MSDHSPDAWRKNVQSKSKEIQMLLREVISGLPSSSDESQKAHFHDKLEMLTQKTKAFHYLYGNDLIPKPLRELTANLISWQRNLANADNTLKIAQLFEPIGALPDYEEPENSFSRILNKHKEDESLQECLSKLIAGIREILDVGDDELSKQAADDLQCILEEIEKRRQHSLLDLGPWVEFALVALGCVADAHCGTSIGTIVAAALIAAKNSNVRIGELCQISIGEYLSSVKIRGRNKLTGPMREKLMNASSAQIERALSQGSLALLPTPVTPALIQGKSLE